MSTIGSRLIFDHMNSRLEKKLPSGFELRTKKMKTKRSSKQRVKYSPNKDAKSRFFTHLPNEFRFRAKKNGEPKDDETYIQMQS